MHPRQEFPPTLRRVIAAQHGAFSVAQALGHGMTRAGLRRHLAAATTVAKGIHIVGDPTWQGFVHASLLRGGPDSALGAGAACHLHGVLLQPPDGVTVWSPDPRADLSLGPWHTRFRRGHRRGFGRPRRTKLEDALLDLAGDADEDTLLEAVTRAFQTGRTLPARLREAMATRPRVHRRRLLEDLCDLKSTGIHSVLEWRFHRTVERAHRLLTPSRQVTVQFGESVDVHYPEFGVIVELDGETFHDRDRDARRDNRNMLRRGMITLRFTWHRVRTDPCGVAAEIVEALRQRGWEGEHTSCGRCVGASNQRM